MPDLIEMPSSACIASIVMSIARVVGNTESPFTLEENSYKWPGERWAIDFNMPPIKSRAVASDWIAFGVSLEGTYGRFLMGDPAAKQPRGLTTGAPKVDGASQNGNILLTKDWTPNITGILKKGDYIQLGTGLMSRLHMVTENINSNGAGKASLTIFPALRYPPADNLAIITSEPKGVFKMSDNTFSWGVSPGGIYRFSFQAQEVVNA